MHGPRLFTRTHLLALAALMLLPACSPRKPIPSDPPEVRTEAMVRGERKAPPARAPQTSPVSHDASDVVVAEAKDEAPSAPLVEPKAETAKPADVKYVEAKSAEAKPAEVAADKTAEAKATEAKSGEAKPEAAKPSEIKQGEVKAEAVKPEPSPAAKADAATQAAQSEPVAGPPPAPRVPVVQIASFTTEKNAEAAAAWLKEKGYSQTRVVRVEQGQTVFHRVQAGPFQDPAAARKALEELKADWPQAFIPAD
jgi:cell division septation protein DedD